MVKFIWLLLIPFCLKGQENGSFKDSRDGNSYQWVEIGEQIWMAENLRYIPFETSFRYKNDPAMEKLYGRLYRWEEASKVCPSGWHLPEGWEVSQLYDYLGGMKLAGGKLKNKGVDLWHNPNKGATNASGFNAIPGGAYSGKLYLTYNSIGKQAYFWTKTEVGEKEARVLQLGYNHSAAYDLGFHPKEWALSVRCVKD